jgi:HJR/Mrr/RecB family endonuclease
LLSGLSVLFALYLWALWHTNRSSFYNWLGLSIVVFALVVGGIIAWRELRRWMKRMRLKILLGILKRTGLEEQVVNFIDRFGFEKQKNAWTHRDHSFDWDRLRDLRKFLNEKGLNLSEKNWNDTLLLLRHYIQQKEERVTRDSLGYHPMKFSDLSGSGFENLLSRLFQAMGYTVQKTGKTGDQGGDLIANKDGQVRMLIQAKCYNGSPVGNAAVQAAVAAQKYYDCNGAMVVTSSEFTKEAIELAKANTVGLVGKERLSELLVQYLKESWS